MSIFKCKMCGGTIEFEQGATVGVCDSCGTKQTLPRLDDDRRANLYDRANHFRRNNEFDKAASIYEQILTEDTADAEAYWSLVLCKYGIEYVEDPATRKRVPTVNRAQFTSVFDDDNYKSALKYADGAQRELYEKEARTINEIQKGILAISQKEEPFDVFICYKETDRNGRRTPDSVLANDIYHQLTQEGFKVFFSRITLEDKLGTAYEPYIFAALNSARVMVVLGTKPEYFNAVWVKNEWSRYLALVKKSGGKKVLIPAYKDMDPYELPDEFSHLQAQDMSKLGFMQDLIRGIKKIAQTEEAKVTVKETVVTAGNTNTGPLLERAFIFLEDGNWEEADSYCEKVLDQEPRNAQAYIGKLMAELHVQRREDLPNCEKPFDGSSNFQKAVRFGDEKTAAELNDCIDLINERNETFRLTGIYNSAVYAMNSARSESTYQAAAAKFKTISGFRDADTLIEQCLEKAEACRKDAVYAFAKSKMSGDLVSGYETAINVFRTIPGWRDADELVYSCQRIIERIKNKEEADRLEREHRAEERRIAAEKVSKKRKKIVAIVLPILAACILIIVLLPTVIIPTAKYNNAVSLYNNGKYNEAITAFKALNGYKDSAAQIEKCGTALSEIHYNKAVALIENGKYEEAITSFKALNGYKDSAEQITKCESALKEISYNEAIVLIETGKYDEAITVLKALDGYKDSTSQITKCQNAIKEETYNKALILMNEKKYSEAIDLLKSLNGYKDSRNQIECCENEVKSEDYSRAIGYIETGEYIKALSILKTLSGYLDSGEQVVICERLMMEKASVGDFVLFGSYEQDNNTSNGNEKIEWLVISKEENRILVISRYALDCKHYHSSGSGCTWASSDLRNWLNGEFIIRAFSKEEQPMLLLTTVTAGSSEANTEDKVFILSAEESKLYFKTDSQRQCKGTVCCFSKGASKDDNGNCMWWMRNMYYNIAGYVSYDGSNYSSQYVFWTDIAVRPAMWVEIGD